MRREQLNFELPYRPIKGGNDRARRTDDSHIASIRQKYCIIVQHIIGLLLRFLLVDLPRSFEAF